MRSAPRGSILVESGRAAVAAAVRSQVPALVSAAGMLASRFEQGGTLFTLGQGPFGADAEHVAVEFLHPVIVGSPALPATPVTGAADLDAHAREGDAVLVLGCSGAIEPSPGVMTLSLSHGSGAGAPQAAGVHLPAGDPWLAKEGFVTCYHLLWEMTHLFLGGGAAGGPDAADLGGTSALYPFLTGGDRSAAPARRHEAAMASCRAKLVEIADLRAGVLEAEEPELASCAGALAAAAATGGRVFVCGNGGSSTDAASFVDALVRSEEPGAGDSPPVPARTLTADRATVTALANDLGYERVFSRQVEALGRPGDVVVGLSTSGGSTNILEAFAAARRKGLVTVGLSGYQGGEMAASGLTDHLFVVPSASVHRIQEVQATLYLALARRARAALARGAVPPGVTGAGGAAGPPPPQPAPG